MPPKRNSHRTERKGFAQPGDVLEISVLAGREREDEALALLKKIHRLVRPIMKKHGFVLPNLSEFFPDNPNLLGVNCNRGERICIRLRHHHAPNAFIELEDSLIPTMLHELTHNTISPHDASFDAQLDKYQDEYDTLRRSGYDGTGLDSLDGEGQKLGRAVGGLGMLPIEVRRRQALAKAEERDRKSRLMGKGGGLGGDIDLKGKSVKEILADAAERRLKGKKGCGASDHSTDGKLPPAVQLEVDKAVRDGKVEVIDLTLDSDDEDDLGTRSRDGSAQEEGREGKRAKQEPLFLADSDDEDVKPFLPPVASTSKLAKPPRKLDSIVPPSSGTSTQPLVVNQKPPSTVDGPSTPTTWSCEICTFQNPLLFLACSICRAERSRTIPAQLANLAAKQEAAKEEKRLAQAKREKRDEGWSCTNCYAMTSHDFWCCVGCGEVKKDSSRSY